MSDHRVAAAAPSIAAFARRSPTDITGTRPTVRFTLEDGSTLEVVHEGDRITVRNTADTERTAILIQPHSDNMVSVASSVPRHA